MNNELQNLVSRLMEAATQASIVLMNVEETETEDPEDLELPDLELLQKFALGTGGRRTGDLMKRGWITVKVTADGFRELQDKLGGFYNRAMAVKKDETDKGLVLAELRGKCLRWFEALKVRAVHREWPALTPLMQEIGRAGGLLDVDLSPPMATWVYCVGIFDTDHHGLVDIEIFSSEAGDLQASSAHKFAFDIAKASGNNFDDARKNLIKQLAEPTTAWAYTYLAQRGRL